MDQNGGVQLVWKILDFMVEGKGQQHKILLQSSEHAQQV